MIVTKILVNWEKKKIVHIKEHRGSTQFQTLLREGYIEVGGVKTPEDAEAKFFWEGEFFDPAAKYPQDKPDKFGGNGKYGIFPKHL